jgi:hypothetical protein
MIPVFLHAIFIPPLPYISSMKMAPVLHALVHAPQEMHLNGPTMSLWYLMDSVGQKPTQA